MLIDPLDPPREVAKPEHVLITVFWHYRSTPGLAAKHVWASKRGVRRLRNRGVEVTDPLGEAGDLPGGLRWFATARESEVVYWLPEQGALAVGDVLLGAGAKPHPTDDPLRLCPARWLGKRTHDDLRGSLRPVLELPLERVLVSHGKPVVSGGERALAAVVD